MNIHEYQAKQILREYGVQVPKGYLVQSPSELEERARQVQTEACMVKAQIHAGGRGKSGGVKRAESITEVLEIGHALMGKKLVTPQTGAAGKRVESVYLEEVCEISDIFYLSMTVDRDSESLVLIASKHGGVEIESESESAIHKLNLDHALGVLDFQVRWLIEIFGVSSSHFKAIKALAENLLACFTENDLSLLELNPLALTKDGAWTALDAKMVFDDNALFRQEKAVMLRDAAQEEPLETAASQMGLSYVVLTGNIGCVVNGAGLAMATMDAIQKSGGQAANFLDVGGSASADMVRKGIELILSSGQASGLFINIFGGIMSCKTVAEGILAASSNFDKDFPIVVRLSGVDSDLGRQMLREFPGAMVFAETLEEGAGKMVQLIGGVRQ